MKISEYIENSKGELLELIKKLCLIPSPSKCEKEKAEFIYTWLKENGAEDVYMDELYNVVCRVNYNEDCDLVMFAAHTDTVFPLETKLEIKQDGDKISCPGIGDDTANVACLLLAARYIIQNKIKTDKGLIFAFDVCEEAMGGGAGATKLVDEYKERLLEFLTIDGFIGEVICDSVCCVRNHVTIRAEGGHAFCDYGKLGAIELMSQFMSELYKFEIPQEENIKSSHNIGVINGGKVVSAICEECEIWYEYRSNNIEVLHSIKKQFNALIDKFVLAGHSINVISSGEEQQKMPVNKEKMDKLVLKCQKNIELVTGKAAPKRMASTDANYPLSLGIPSTCIGCYEGGGMHSEDEYLFISSLPKGLEMLINLILLYRK